MAFGVWATRFLRIFSFYSLAGVINKKTGMPDTPVLIHMVLKQNALPNQNRCTHLITALPLSRSSPCGFLFALALEGRRKPVILASEVSADLSDF